MWKPIDALVSLSKMWISTAYCFSEIKSILPEEEPANASPHPVFSSIPHPTHTGSLSTPWFRIRKTIFPIVWLGSWWPNSSFLQSLLKSSWSTSKHNLCKQWSRAYFLEARVQGITSPSPLTGFTSKVKFTRNDQSCKHHWHRACWLCHGWSLYHKDMNKWGVHYHNNLSLFMVVRRTLL